MVCSIYILVMICKLLQPVVLLLFVKCVITFNCPNEMEIHLKPHNLFTHYEPPFMIIYLETCSTPFPEKLSLYFNTSITPSVELNETCRLELYISQNRYADLTDAQPSLPRFSIKFWTNLSDLELALWNCPEIPIPEFESHIRKTIKKFWEMDELKYLYNHTLMVQEKGKIGGPTDAEQHIDGSMYYFLSIPLLLLISILMIFRLFK